MRKIVNRLEKLEKVFARVAASATIWGSMAKFRDKLLLLAEQRDAPSVAALRDELDRLGPVGSGAKQPAATCAITGSSRAGTKVLRKRWREHSGLVRTS